MTIFFRKNSNVADSSPANRHPAQVRMRTPTVVPPAGFRCGLARGGHWQRSV